MHPALRRLDLNLLPVFDAVYRHRSVRLAAEELITSTSALSHALSRLRVALNDPLFYREGHRMCPSVYATQLAPSIASVLAFLNQELIPQPDFSPAVSTDCLQIAVTDFTAFCIFPALMRQVQLMAPNLRFELRYLPHSPALNELAIYCGICLLIFVAVFFHLLLPAAEKSNNRLILAIVTYSKQNHCSPVS